MVKLACCTNLLRELEINPNSYYFILVHVFDVLIHTSEHGLYLVALLMFFVDIQVQITIIVRFISSHLFVS